MLLPSNREVTRIDNSKENLNIFHTNSKSNVKFNDLFLSCREDQKSQNYYKNKKLGFLKSAGKIFGAYFTQIHHGFLSRNYKSK